MMRAILWATRCAMIAASRVASSSETSEASRMSRRSSRSWPLISAMG
jgi:hypothetical protein